MPDNPSSEPVPPAEAGNTTTVTHVSGGVNLDAERDVNIDGDVVGRDKIVSTPYITGDQQSDVHGLANPYLGLPQFDAPSDFSDFLKTHTPPQQVNVIVIDQFEELFTQSDAQPRDALFNLLTHLLPFRSTRTHIIATVRADYLPELFALPELYDIAKRDIDLRAMSVDELREAIQQPLRVTYPDRDKRFQSELVDCLAKDATEDAAYLPLLQVTLEEIWRKSTLTLGTYTNLADAIKHRADKVLTYQDYDAAQSSQPRAPEEQAAILNLCLDLVDVSLDDEARRDVRRRAKDELINGAPERARLIDTLAQARLLSVATDSGEQTRVESVGLTAQRSHQ